MNNTVLIIDDDDMLRQTLANGLRTDGFDVITAASAEHGTEILNKISVDAIVLDRMMGGMDGLAFLQSRRAIGDRTPIIILTALGGAENAIDGLGAGADDYLAKPFQLRELILRLRNIIKKHDSPHRNTLPDGLTVVDDEFFVRTAGGDVQALGLSGEEKKLMQRLTTPFGNVAPAAPMVAKRLRMKLKSVLSDIDIITVRGRGYKLVLPDTATQQNGDFE